MSTNKGLGKIPSPYQHLSFSSYNVLAPRDPAWKDKIAESDLNCAVSAPNALIGSRYTGAFHSLSAPEGAYFEVANTSSPADGLSHFTLLSLQIKPLAAPESGTTVTIKGYSHAHEDPLTWTVYFDSGYTEPLLIKIREFSKQQWDHLYGVEILADYGEDKLDWEFCLDDLELLLFNDVDENINSQPWHQQVLKSN